MLFPLVEHYALLLRYNVPFRFLNGSRYVCVRVFFRGYPGTICTVSQVSVRYYLGVVPLSSLIQLLSQTKQS